MFNITILILYNFNTSTSVVFLNKADRLVEKKIIYHEVLISTKLNFKSSEWYPEYAFVLKADCTSPTQKIIKLLNILKQILLFSWIYSTQEVLNTE